MLAIYNKQSKPSVGFLRFDVVLYAKVSYAYLYKMLLIMVAIKDYRRSLVSLVAIFFLCNKHTEVCQQRDRLSRFVQLFCKRKTLWQVTSPTCFSRRYFSRLQSNELQEHFINLGQDIRYIFIQIHSPFLSVLLPSA